MVRHGSQCGADWWLFSLIHSLYSLVQQAHFCLNGQYQPENTQNGKTVLPITNLMADSEPGSPVSYPSFLVTICLSRLVSEIFACHTQTDRRTMRTITIAGLHIVAGQLINRMLQKTRTRGQSNLARAAPNNPRTHCTRRRLNPSDRQIDTVNIGNNSLHFMHSMPPKILKFGVYY